MFSGRWWGIRSRETGDLIDMPDGRLIFLSEEHARAYFSFIERNVPEQVPDLYISQATAKDFSIGLFTYWMPDRPTFFRCFELKDMRTQ